MDNNLFRNGSGYADPTAYKAILKYQKGESIMEFNRGEIFEYNTNNGESKKALVLSADFRKESRYISILVLQDEPKGMVNVPIRTAGGIMYADCGLVSFCSNDRLGDYLRVATDEEMQQIDESVARCLGIESKTVEVEKIVEVTPPPMILPEANEGTVEIFSEELATAKAEAKIFKDLYEKLLEKMIG